jgi:WD40 repeat protein
MADATEIERLVPYESASELRAANSRLLDAYDHALEKDSSADGDTAALRAIERDIKDFLKRGVATGAYIEETKERTGCQVLLDYWVSSLSRIGAALSGVRLARFDGDQLPDLKDKPCPYVGLEAFRDKKFFFGRDADTEALSAQVRDSPLVIVFGASGSGKSSLVMGGVLPALAANDNPPPLRIVPTFVPGNAVLRNLAEVVTQACAAVRTGVDNATRQLRADAGHLWLMVGGAHAPPTVIVIDQFEEVFTLSEIADRDALVANLARLLDSPQGHRVILTMREEFRSRMVELEGFKKFIDRAWYPMRPMGYEELKAAVEQPAAMVNLQYQSGIVDDLVKKVLGQPAALPLLQFTLRSLWDKRDRNRITWEVYNKVGDPLSALKTSADQFYDRLAPQTQAEVRRVLLELVRVDDLLEAYRQPVPRGRLMQAGRANTDEVLQLLAKNDYIRITSGDSDTESVVEVKHESLIRNWPRFVAWIDEKRYERRQRLALTEAVSRWAQSGRPQEGLLTGWQLQESRHLPDLSDLEREFVEASSEAVEQLDREKENTLRREAEQAKALAEAQRQRADEQAAARMRQRRLMWRLVVVLVLAVVAAGFGWYQKNLAQERQGEAQKSAKAAQESARIARINAFDAAVQRTLAEESSAEAMRLKGAAEENAAKADQERMKASSRENATHATQYLQSDPKRAVEYAIKAFGEASTPEAAGALQQAVLAFRLPGRIFQGMQSNEIVRITPDIAVVRSRSDSKVRLHNVTAGGQPTVIDARGPTSLIILSPNGKYVVIPDSETSVGVWETATGKLVAGPLRIEGRLTHTFFSPHGEIMGVMTNVGKLSKVDFWDTQTWRPLPTIDGLEYYRPELIGGTPSQLRQAFQERRPMALSHDSKYFVGMSQDLRLRVWEIATAKEVVSTISDDTRNVKRAAFSPDGKYIVTETVTDDFENTFSLWTTKLERIREIGDHSRPVNRVQFSPDGSQLVTVASDGVRIWSIDEAGALKEFRHLPGVKSIHEISEDGKSMLTIERDVIRVWRSPFNQLIELRGHAGGISNARFSQDGRWIVSASAADGTAKLWDVINQRLVANFLVPSISDARLSTDSRRLITSSRDGTRKIWDTIEFGAAKPLSDLPESEATNRLKSEDDDIAAISPDGKTLLAIGPDEFARIWDTATGHLKAKLGDGDHKAKRVLLSANGKRAITIGRDKTARVWDVETGLMLASLPGDGKAELVAGSFSDDAHPWTWHKGEAIRVWSLKEGKPSVISFIQASDVSCVTVSPKVSWIVTCEQVEEQKEGTGEKKEKTAVVRVRQLISGKEAKEIGQLRGHTVRINDVFFSQDGKLALSASYDKTAKLWEVGSWRTIATLSGHIAAVKLAFFSPDTKYVVTAAEDNTARIWETTKGTLISELRGHNRFIHTLAFSAAGRWVATGSEDHTVRVWDIKTGKAVGELYGHRGPVIAVAFSQVPKEIISASADGTIIRYQCAHCIPAAELLAIAQQRLKANGKLVESAPQR